MPPGQPDSHTGDKSWIAVQVLAIDNDGYITNWTIDFGDGSALVHLAAGAGKCVDGPDGWPQNNSASIGQGADWPTLNHHFSTTGQYTVTYTAYSAGCDGRDVQSGSVHYSYYVP
ncbi:MAG: hypothetical protein ACJ735_04725 [Actinomycetes bacterium]